MKKFLAIFILCLTLFCGVGLTACAKDRDSGDIIPVDPGTIVLPEDEDEQYDENDEDEQYNDEESDEKQEDDENDIIPGTDGLEEDEKLILQKELEEKLSFVDKDKVAYKEEDDKLIVSVDASNADLDGDLRQTVEAVMAKIKEKHNISYEIKIEFCFAVIEITFLEV